MFDKVVELAAELVQLEGQLSDPALHQDQNKAREVGRRFSQIKPIVATWREWQQVTEDIEAAKELAEEDSSFATEVKSLLVKQTELADKLKILLVPRDPLDDKDVIIEVKSGEGGQESALFAADLVRMYLRFADRQGWKSEVLEAEESDMGGYKDAAIAFKAKGTPEPGQAPYAWLKHEGGVHRVQRVPITESQGRIHTSAAGVMVFPEAEEIDVQMNMEDLKIDVYRSSGPGGQSVNTTDSAVRITHLPTGIVVSCQNEKSQLQNKEAALRILRARLLAAAEEERAIKESASRKSQVRTVDRSERIRTYNFPENRITDHRTNYKAHNLDQVLDGDLNAVLQSSIEQEAQERLMNYGDLA
jgi:peptide chain release factor 1